MLIQRAYDRMIEALYPPRCIACPAETDQPDGLCPACWSQAEFISGATCPTCGTPVFDDGLQCEHCTRYPPGWDRGAAAMIYDGIGRRVVLSFKHGDRLDMGKALARWMYRAGGAMVDEADVIAPVPAHWSRTIKRGYNQSAELARALGAVSGREVAPNLLRRTRRTPPLKGMTRDIRRQHVQGSIATTEEVSGQAILIVDDVLTTGATLGACSDALRAAGAARVDVLTVTRVLQDRVPEREV
ncbi:ComF family protein [Rubricella aquisinus]|uniref:ComF family protein n=1 Tax=Rubricella aquisinus TaxID=2028108 RepID=A0A840WII6_9RHOB|nr:ComF family protein [Rubricella aquisinus]MBB5514033.1 ComF family protein [Rubricella aquisinus]